MKHISSRDNPLYKRLWRLTRGRRNQEASEPGVVQAQNHIILEGIHLCQAWVQHIGPPELALFDLVRLGQDEEMSRLAQLVPDDRRISCDSQLMRSLSHLEQGQSVYFMVSAPQPVVPARITTTGLWLDRIQDPGNVGTLLRTAAAAGLKHVYLSPGCASAWSPKVLRSAQGAHFVMSIYEHVDLHAECEKLAVPLLATALSQAQSLYEAILPPQCVWLFGNEGQGVDPGLLTRAHVRVFIPQVEQVESLNVAAAAAICLFEHRRQRLYN